MSKFSRSKGARGEREFRDILRTYGWACERDGSQAGDLKGDLPAGFRLEIKRAETLKIPDWVKQAKDDAKEDEIPVVVFRRSNLNGDPLGKWHVIEPADSWLARLRELTDLRG